MPKIRETRFPVASSWTGKLPTCCGNVSDMAVRHVANKTVTSWQQVVVEFGKRRDTTDTTDFCGAKLLRTCYGFKRLKVKGLDIYIPPLTGKPWPAAVYNSKWRTDRQ